MNSEIQSLLKSPLPADRKRGLQMLAKSDDPQDLKVLSALHKRETDPELKQLIVQVGKTVKQRVDAASASPAPVSKAASSVPRPLSKAAVSTGGGTNQAAAFMQQAQEALIELDFDNAKALARKAFTLNPDLQHDEDARNLAGDIFATSADEAVAQLLGKSSNSAGSADVLDWVDGVSSVDRGKSKRKSKGEQTDVTWGTALLDVGMYGLFSGAALFLIMLGLIFVFGSTLEALITSESANTYDSVQMAQFAEIISSMGLVFALIYGVIAAFATMASYMIWFGIIHFAATTFLGGDGSYRGVLHRAFMPMIVWLIVSYVLGAVGGYFAFQSLGNMASIEQMNNFNSTNSLASTLNFIVAIGFSLWLSAAIGDNYRFGMGKGCLSIFVSYIVIFALACGCAFFLTSMLANSASYPGFIPLFG
jgi:hypothetical protein